MSARFETSIQLMQRALEGLSDSQVECPKAREKFYKKLVPRASINLAMDFFAANREMDRRDEARKPHLVSSND